MTLGAGDPPHLVVLPMLVPLSTALLALGLRRWPRLQRAASLAGVAAYAVAVAALAVAVLPNSTLVYRLGDWAAPYGIVLVADALSAFMLALTAAVVVPALVFAVRSVSAFGQRLSFHALFHLMVLGTTGAFLTGDVFNLFVWFEVMLMASYALVAFHGDRSATRGALYYVALNLLGSAVMLVAIGGLYATVGTLNMADVARRLADPGAYGVDPAPVLGFTGLLFAVFALKAGLAPFQFWVPGAYRAAPTPVTAVLAGAVKKVGVYAVVRLTFTVYAGAALEFYAPVLLAVAGASILVGGVGAVAREDLADVLSFSSISQVGFVVLPLSVAAAAPGVRELAVAAALVYALNHALAKSMLFMVAGALRSAAGTARLGDLGGLARTSPVLSGAFLVGGLALVGIPPLSGFFGKLLVLDAAVGAEASAAVALALLGAVLSIAYVSRAWSRGFWGAPSPYAERASPDPVLAGVIVALALAVVLVGLGFDPVYRFAIDAAAAALDGEAYVDAVDPEGPA